MSIFFRKIRKKFAYKKQFLKYSRYAIGEIVLVVIGILIALQINNWNEYNKERINEKSYLKRLLFDYKENIVEYNELIDIHDKGIKKIEVFLDTIYKNVSSADEYAKIIQSSSWEASEIKISDITFFEISNSGKLDIIQNQNLREQILKYHKLVEVSSNHIEEMNKTGLDMFTKIYPHINKYFLYDKNRLYKYTPKDWEYFNDPTSDLFKQLEGTSFHYLFKYYFILEYTHTLKEKAQYLIDEIEIELSKNK